MTDECLPLVAIDAFIICVQNVSDLFVQCMYFNKEVVFVKLLGSFIQN